MKVKITHVVEVNDMEREAIAFHYGADGKADHSTCRDFFLMDFDLDTAVKKYYQFQAEKYAKLASVDANE